MKSMRSLGMKQPIGSSVMPMSCAQLEGLVSLVYDLAVELTRHRPGGEPRWVMLADIEEALRQHELDSGELQAAIAIAIERRLLRAAGTPVHSICPWRNGWQIDRAE